jgi:hypothetical protein
MRRILDPELLDAMDALAGERYDGDAWRVTWATRDPLAGNAAGGRWSPDDGFETLYTSLKEDGAMAEVYYHLSKAPVFSSSHVLMNRLHVSLTNGLRLSGEQPITLGIEEPLASRIDYERSKAIGAAAHLLDFEGLIVPSARWECDNLVLFLDRFDIDAQLQVTATKNINWPAWRERVNNR